MIGHLGTRVSALLDGQLSDAETENAWEHVHGCHVCRDAVEHEGWVKTRLAGLTWSSTGAPEHLKGSLLGAGPVGGLGALGFEDTERRLGLFAIGGSAVGAAVLAVLAVGVGPAECVGGGFGIRADPAASTKQRMAAMRRGQRPSTASRRCADGDMAPTLGAHPRPSSR